MNPPPWLFILLGWALLLAATTATVRVCLRNAPKEVPLDTQQLSQPGHAF